MEEHFPLLTEDYFARVSEPRQSVLASPLATRMMRYLDLMHILQRGGQLLVWRGALLLAQGACFGATKKLRLGRVYSDRHAWYNRRPTMLKLPRVLLANCKQDDWAELGGPAFKAAIARRATKAPHAERNGDASNAGSPGFLVGVFGYSLEALPWLRLARVPSAS